MILLTLLACDDTQFPAPPGGEATAGSDYVAMRALFDAECVQCHDASGLMLGGLDLALDPCNTLVGVASEEYPGATLVVPGDHEASVLWNKMADTGTFGAVMPQSGALSSEYVDGVATWIDEGATCEEPIDTGDSGGADDTGDSGDTGEPPPDPYGLDTVQTEVFDIYCVVCHGPDGSADWMPLTEGESYGQLVNVDAYSSLDDDELYVAPGDPEGSFLWRKMRGPIDPEEGEIMPSDSPALSTETLLIVYGWIYEGAPE